MPTQTTSLLPLDRTSPLSPLFRFPAAFLPGDSRTFFLLGKSPRPSSAPLPPSLTFFLFLSRCSTCAARWEGRHNCSPLCATYVQCTPSSDPVACAFRRGETALVVVCRGPLLFSHLNLRWEEFSCSHRPLRIGDPHTAARTDKRWPPPTQTKTSTSMSSTRLPSPPLWASRALARRPIRIRSGASTLTPMPLSACPRRSAVHQRQHTQRPSRRHYRPDRRLAPPSTTRHCMTHRCRRTSRRKPMPTRLISTTMTTTTMKALMAPTTRTRPLRARRKMMTSRGRNTLTHQDRLAKYEITGSERVRRKKKIPPWCRPAWMRSLPRVTLPMGQHCRRQQQVCLPAPLPPSHSNWTGALFLWMCTAAAIATSKTPGIA